MTVSGHARNERRKDCHGANFACRHNNFGSIIVSIWMSITKRKLDRYAFIPEAFYNKIGYFQTMLRVSPTFFSCGHNIFRSIILSTLMSITKHKLDRYAFIPEAFFYSKNRVFSYNAQSKSHFCLLAGITTSDHSSCQFGCQ